MEKGSIIKLDYDAYTVEGHNSGRDKMTKQGEVIEAEGELFDTTSAETAKKHDKFHDDAWYGPVPVVVGAGRVVPGFDNALLDAKVGEKREITVPAGEAYGEKDPAKFETMALREFQKREVEPHPGARISIGNRAATVVSVTAGRVRLDFNPPLAGRTLKYSFRIVEEVTEPAAQVLAIIDMDYGHGRLEGFQAEVDREGVTVTLPDACKYDQRWFVAKYVVASDVKNFTKLKTVRLVEEYAPPDSSKPGDEPAGIDKTTAPAKMKNVAEATPERAAKH